MLGITTFIYPDNRGLGQDKLDRFKFKTINADEKGEKLCSFCAQWLWSSVKETLRIHKTTFRTAN